MMAIHVVTCIVSNQALKTNIHTPLFVVMLPEMTGHLNHSEFV
jgi:hypothetical protein